MGMIYMVTSGSYSDYRVHMAFTSEDMANAFAERVSKSFKIVCPLCNRTYVIMDNRPRE